MPCDDTKAFDSEARHRVRRHRESLWPAGDGGMILILGKDEDGKTDDLQDILVRVDEEFSRTTNRRTGPACVVARSGASVAAWTDVDGSRGMVSGRWRR
ncbi:MAG: hypothetical protein OXE82_15005, partial [Rhodobacter sp.]|nr:hypothetical protein [Rhodobacter sp.]